MKCPLNCENITHTRMDVSRFFDEHQMNAFLNLNLALSVGVGMEKSYEASLRRATAE